MAIGAELIGSITADRVRARAAPRSKINVVLFSGGSGTHSITEALRRHPQISLTILINAYDDGHSTGRLRRFVPGMLGPSDVRKNINRLMPLGERSQKCLRSVSDHRLPVGISRTDALNHLDWIVEGKFARLPVSLAGAFPQLTCWQLQHLQARLERFLGYVHQQAELEHTFDFTDCALGNLLFAGCYLEQDRDFNRAIEVFAESYEVDRNSLLNITCGENLFLVAEKENGTFLRNEAEIVAAQDQARISELFLIDGPTYLNGLDRAVAEPSGGWRALCRAASRVPRANPRAVEAVAAADIIVYGPGTQHSSLFPSYMTEGVAEMIAANTAADKVFIGNIHRDFDIQADDASDLARKLLDAMSRKGAVAVEWLDLVTHFFVQVPDDSTTVHTRYVPFDRARFEFPLNTIKARDWEAQEGRHAGGYVLDELRGIVQSHIDVALAPLRHMVSIVIPVLNEEATIESVLKSVTALDFQELGLSKEVILVDGGSTDRTLERARGARNLKILRLPPGSFGRGATMRLGLEKARGDLIVFFPADDEYRAEDLTNVVSSLVKTGFRAVFGTRAVKCTNLSEQLKRVYGRNRRGYLTSKYGGMLLSFMTLLIYNRYVTDVLSSVKGFDAHLLRSLNLQSSGLDLETEIVAKLSRRREYMLEMPVEYTPRTRAAGKKIRTPDGLRALWALWRYRRSAARAETAEWRSSRS